MKVGDLFLRYESHRGSGEEGCYQAFRIVGEKYPDNNCRPVRWIAHSCGRRPHKSVAMYIEHYEGKGQIIWLKET